MECCKRWIFVYIEFIKIVNAMVFGIYRDKMIRIIKRSLYGDTLWNKWFKIFIRENVCITRTRIHWLDRQIVRKQLDIMPTYHYVQNQGKLIMQSRGNGQKPQFGRFVGQISRNCKFFWKNRFHSNWRPYLVLTSGRKPKKSLESFLRKMSKCLILG